MKLNEKRVELLKNRKVILHNQNFRKDLDLLNQIMSKCLNRDICSNGTTKYYAVFKYNINKYDWDASNNIKHLNKGTEEIPLKPISWFFEEEINNILILI